MGNFLAGIKGRLLAWAVVAAVIIPCALCGLSEADKPQTYPGDKMDRRTCHDCNGSGEVNGKECTLCDGKGKVYVTVPGPNHPSWVPIKVHEAGVAQSTATQETTEELLKPIPGGIGGAQLSFSKGEEKSEGSSTFTGRTKVRLTPGTWSYTVKRAGYKDVSGTLEVPVLTSEIWKARSPEDTLAAPLLIPMAK